MELTAWIFGIFLVVFDDIAESIISYKHLSTLALSPACNNAMTTSCFWFNFMFYSYQSSCLLIVNFFVIFACWVWPIGLLILSKNLSGIEIPYCCFVVVTYQVWHVRGTTVWNANVLLWTSPYLGVEYNLYCEQFNGTEFYADYSFMLTEFNTVVVRRLEAPSLNSTSWSLSLNAMLLRLQSLKRMVLAVCILSLKFSACEFELWRKLVI